MNDIVRDSHTHHFPVFKKGDIIHFQTSESQSNKIVEGEIIGIESHPDCDYLHDGNGMGVCYCVKVGNEIIHNLYGFAIEELKKKQHGG